MGAIAQTSLDLVKRSWFWVSSKITPEQTLCLFTKWKVLGVPQKSCDDSFAPKVDEARERADGATYQHLLDIDKDLRPFRMIQCLPRGGLIPEVGMIFLDFLLDMTSVLTMLQNEDICFAGVIFTVSVVSVARQLAHGAFGQLLKDAYNYFIIYIYI